MEDWEREGLVARVCSGTARIKIGGTLYRVGTPSQEARQVAAEIYEEALSEARLGGCLTRDEAVRTLTKRGVWTEKDAEQLKLLDEKVDEFKVAIFQAWGDPKLRSRTRVLLDAARAEIGRLEAVRGSLDHATCEGVAAAARARFLVGSSVTAGGSPYWADPEEDWSRPDRLLDDLLAEAAAARLPDSSLRELARTEPWRSVWACRKQGGQVFDRPSSLLGDEQKSLVAWSVIYDSVREHPDCPDESVVQDDDMLDGWMIVQRKRREAEVLRKRGEEEFSNPKLKNAQEVFKVASSPEEVARIGDLNDSTARQRKHQRLAHLKKHSVVAEQDMPDTRMENQMAFNQANAARIASRGGGS